MRALCLFTNLLILLILVAVWEWPSGEFEWSDWYLALVCVILAGLFVLLWVFFIRVFSLGGGSLGLTALGIFGCAILFLFTFGRKPVGGPYSGNFGGGVGKGGFGGGFSGGGGSSGGW